MAEDMRTRAAKATAKVWDRYPNYSVCVRGPIDGRSGAPKRMPSLGGPTPQEFADAALLAAFDPEDEALVEFVAREMACGPLKHPILWPQMTEEARIDWRLKAAHAIAALKQAAQGGQS